MGDRAAATDRLRRLIRQANPKAKKILELGCGTGSVLKHLAKDYEVWGVDLSGQMLSIARKKVAKAKLFRQDMVTFRLPQKFDVIFCVYDSINHLLRFAAWKHLFANVARHLSEDGVFIFDINTQKKLDRHIAEPPWVHKFGNNVLIMTITAAPRSASNWNIKVFERIRGNRYTLHEESIQEASFPANRIVSALKPHFRKVKVIDPDRKGEKLYFVCKK